MAAKMSLDDEAAFQRTLDELYAGYMSKRALVSGLYDRQFKDPAVILDIARKLDLLPSPSRVVKITGSKGKGSTSRLIAFYLRRLLGPDAKVALFISPEEFVHTDRMRINGVEITPREFVCAYRDLLPHLKDAERSLPEISYLSPFGIMLLIALVWYKAQGAAWYVMETGRGAAHDEVGMMPGEVAVITSILHEHPDNLGPTICDIASEKAAIAGTATRTIASLQALHTMMRCALPQHAICVPEDEVLAPRSSAPAWLALDDRLARQAVLTLIQTDDRRLLDIDVSGVSVAWGRLHWQGLDVTFDAMINLDSLDREWFERAFATGKTLILYSLPDDKDRARLKAFVRGLPNAESREIVLSGKRVYLKYDDAEAQTQDAFARFHYEDRNAFLSELSRLATVHAPANIYCFGTQTFIRLVRGALSDAPPPR